MDNEDLKELDAIFKDMGGVDKIDDFTNSFEELADGDYTGEIEKVSSKVSKKTGRPMLEVIVALEGGRKDWVYLMLAGEDLKKTQTAIARTVTQLKKLGVTGTDVSDFINGAMELTGKKVNLNIKTNNGYKNRELTLA